MFELTLVRNLLMKIVLPLATVYGLQTTILSIIINTIIISGIMHGANPAS